MSSPFYYSWEQLAGELCVTTSLDIVKINLEARTKAYTFKKKIEFCLGYITLNNLIQLLLKINSGKIFENGNISEEGSLILTKFYFDQLFGQEKESILQINRNILETMDFSNIENIQEVKTLLEDYLNICKILVPQIYNAYEKEIESLYDSLETLNSGSKLVSHLIKLVIPFQRLVHLPRGHSYKI